MRSKFCKKWKKREKTKLKQQLAQGINIRDVKIPGRDWNGIRGVAKRLKLIGRLRNPPYTEAQKAKLRELREQGFTCREIAECNFLNLPRSTYHAIQHACSKAGAVNVNMSNGRKNRKIWKSGEEKEFCAFLLEHPDMATKKIARQFGIVEGTVRLWRRKLFPKPPALPFEEWILKEEERLDKLFLRMSKKKWIVPPLKKQCRTCGRIWFKSKQFFPCDDRKAKSNSMTVRFFRRDCVICTARKRWQERIANQQCSK